MATFGTYPLAELARLRAEMKDLARASGTLREAAQLCVERLYREFGESLVLARLFATVPFGFLPEQEQAYARRLAAQRNALDGLTEDTTVVTLLATRGMKQEWNDVRTSHQRLAVPLLNPSFLKTIPLVGRRLGNTMLDLPWLEEQRTLVMVNTMGKMSQLVYVGDARTTLAGDGQKAVFDQKFVDTYGVRTVLALGGSYLNGTVVVLMLFTNEELVEEQVTKLTPLVNTIKAATMQQVMDSKIV